MREIKFRGKRVDNGEWEYGLPTYILKEDKFEIRYPLYDSDGYRGYSRYEVIPETVGQFTGLYDKNGREIYEWDIIASDTTWDFIVCFEKGHTVIKWTDYDSSKLSENLEQEYINEEECIIIGNIYDNKEML